MASITTEGLGPCLAVEGSTTREVLEAYLEHVLAPTLRSAQVVLIDDLSAHKGGKVEEIIEGRGCKLIYLPPYSPDLNPIEEALSKIEGLMRKTGARTRGALIEAMGRALDAVTAHDARGFFGHCGYRQISFPNFCRFLLLSSRIHREFIASCSNARRNTSVLVTVRAGV